MRVILRGTDSGIPWQTTRPHRPTQRRDADATRRAPRTGRAPRRPRASSRRPPASAPSFPATARRRRRQPVRKAAESRERARVGMANGEEKYLPMRDRGAAEAVRARLRRRPLQHRRVLIPVMFLVIILTFIPSHEVQTTASSRCGASSSSSVVDVVDLGFILHAQARGESTASRQGREGALVRRDARAAAAPVRLPKPQVKRGQFPA